LIPAGTYVKEFVHGDLGRTTPSVCSLLGCQADILQLDVVWLFDDFEGGGEPPEPIEPEASATCDGRSSSSSSSSSSTSSAGGGSEVWRRLPLGALRNLPLASSKGCRPQAP